MTYTPFLNGELAALRQADLRREATDRPLAREARRARKDRRRVRRVREATGLQRNPQPASRIVFLDNAPGQ